MSVSRTILIVEDEAVLREAYELILQSAGYNTFVATDGKDAMDLLKQINPDVMLLDVYMPVLDGCSVLKKLNRNKHPGMKIVACSNLADNSVRREILDNGADMFVLKSGLSPKQLVNLMNTLSRKA